MALILWPSYNVTPVLYTISYCPNQSDLGRGGSDIHILKSSLGIYSSIGIWQAYQVFHPQSVFSKIKQDIRQTSFPNTN